MVRSEFTKGALRRRNRGTQKVKRIALMAGLKGGNQLPDAKRRGFTAFCVSGGGGGGIRLAVV
jgi:hypothetical protein